MSVSSPNSPKQLRAQKTRQKILDSTLHLLEETGIEKISTNAIARHAGVNIASLYKYFPDKYAILRELALNFGQKQSDLICSFLESAAPNSSIEQICHGLVDALIDGTRNDLALVQLQRSLIVMPELLEDYRRTNIDIGEAMAPFLYRWGISQSKAEAEVSTTCLGEISSALQDLALSRKPDYDPAIIDKLKFVLTAYYEALQRRALSSP